MQYHLSEQLPAQEWETRQAAVLESVRQRALHDLTAQHPGSMITVDAVQHTVRRAAAGSTAPAVVVVDFVCDYTVGGAPNSLDA